MNQYSGSVLTDKLKKECWSSGCEQNFTSNGKEAVPK